MTKKKKKVRKDYEKQRVLVFNEKSPSVNQTRVPSSNHRSLIILILFLFPRFLRITIRMNEFKQKLHRDLPPTLLWGYNGIFPVRDCVKLLLLSKEKHTKKKTYKQTNKQLRNYKQESTNKK